MRRYDGLPTDSKSSEPISDLEADLAEFLARGGQIERVPSGLDTKPESRKDSAFDRRDRRLRDCRLVDFRAFTQLTKGYPQKWRNHKNPLTPTYSRRTG